MKKPIIGIVPLVDVQRESLWMLPGYMDGIAQAGGIGIMLPLTQDGQAIEQMVQFCDGLVFTGGQDLEPGLYGEEKSDLCGECVPQRDAMETVLLAQALASDKPVLGICRGFQFLNAHLGGTLYQDIPTQRPSQVNHRQPAPYDQPIHPVELSGPLAELLHQTEIRVNSCHHQGLKTVAPSLSVMAQAPDGLPEAVYLPGKRFVWAVQWHPEFAWKVDENSRNIFRAFVEAAKE